MSYGFYGNPLAPTWSWTTVQPAPSVTSISPNIGIQGKTLHHVTVRGTFFESLSTFSLGSGITVSSLVIVNATTATMNLIVSDTAPLGFHNLTVTDPAGSGTLINAFIVQPKILGFPQSGLDPKDMAVLGTTGTQTLYWDYGNTQDFYILLAAGQFGLTQPVLVAVSPLFASNWFGNQAPSVTYDPFSYNNPTAGSNFSDI